MSNAPTLPRPAPAVPREARTIRPRRSLPGGRAVVGAFLVVLAAVGTFGAHLTATAAPSTSYLVAARPFEIGHVLAEEDLVLGAGVRAVPIDLPAEQAGRAVVADAADVASLVGRVVVAPILPGDLVQHTALVGVEQAGDGVTMSFSLPVDRALAGRLGAGERVDVMATFSGAGALGSETRVVARDVTVVGVLAGGDGLNGGRVTMTIEVSDLATAQQVQHAVDTAQVALLRGGDASAPTPGATRSTPSAGAQEVG